MSGNYHRYHGDDPYWACHAGEQLHPLYRQCLLCKHVGHCDLFDVELIKSVVEPAPKPTTYEMPRREFVLSKSKFEDKIWEFHLKHGLVYKPEETVYYDRVAGHYAHHKFSLKWWLKRLWQQIKDAF